MCDQQSLRSACAYAQSDQSLCLSLEYSMTVKLLTDHHLKFLSWKGGCTGSSESTLVKIPHCWKSHVGAQLLSHIGYTCICVYHNYSGTLNTFRHAMPFKQSKSNIQRIHCLNQFFLSNVKWDTFIPSKVFISFVELSVFYLFGSQNVQVTSKLSP